MQLATYWQELNKRYWEAAENLEKSTGIPFFSKFVTPLELKGVPSLLALLGIVLVLIGAGAFYATQSPTATGVFTIRVLSAEGQPLDGIAVTLTAQDGSATQTVVAINGVAEFSLPSGKKYTLSVASDLEPSVQFVVPQPGRTQQIRLVPKQSTASVFLFAENSAGLPVNGAQVEYAYGDSVKSSKTNATGYAPLFVNENVTVNVTVTAANYESASVSFEPAKVKVKKITLLEQLVGKAANLNLLALQRNRISSPLNATLTGSVKINVKHLSDNGFRPVANAYVAIYNGFSKTLIAEARTNTAGLTDFRNVPSTNDFNIYAVVEADGFVTVQTDQVKFEDSLELDVLLTTANVNNSVDFLVKLTDSQGSGRGDVYIVSTQGAILAKRLGTNGQTVIRGLPKQNFYVAVTGQQYVRFVSALINPDLSTQLNVALKIANSTNSGKVTVITKDFDNHLISQASVNVFISNVVSPAEVKTNSQGVAVFTNVPLGLPITAKGEKNSFVGQATSMLIGDINQTIVLKPPTGTVALSVVDFTTNQPLFNPVVKLFYKATPTSLIELPANCSITAEAPSCTLSLISSVKYVATASLDGFHSSSIEFEATPFEHNGVRLRMFPASFNEQVAFMGIFDSQDGRKLEDVETMAIGKIYSAKFAVKTNKDLTAAGNYGLYSRLGGSGSLLSGSPVGIAFISPEFSPSGSLFYSQFANASRSYSPGSCTSDIEQNGFGLYKWAFAGGEPGLAPAEYVETIVPIAAISAGSTTLEYFALTTFGENGTVDQVIRYPTDIDLGESYSVGEKKWCDSRTKSISLSVESKDNSKCNAFACIQVWATQGENIFFDAATAESTDSTQHNLDIHYKVIDFLQTPTPLSFLPPEDMLKLDAGHTDVPSAVNSAENKYENTLSTFRAEGAISTIVQPRRANQDLRVQFGQKIYADIELEVLAPPDPPVELGELGTRYEVLYDRVSDSFKLVDENGESADYIEMYSDPLLPADAVFIYINYSSSPCQSGENNFQYLLRDNLTCFEVAPAPVEFVDNPVAGLKVLKYDASAPSCGAYSVDLNKVNEANAQLSLQHSCTPANGVFDIRVKVRPEIAADSQDQYKALLSHVVYSEPTDDLGEENPFAETPHALTTLLVNRQLAPQDNVALGGANGYLFDEYGTQVIYHLPGSTNAKSSLAGSNGKNFKDDLGAVTPPYLTQLFTSAVKDKQLTPDNFEEIKNQVKIIAKNTVFRRAPDGCDLDPACKLKEFPYALFRPNKDFSFQLGAAYLGTNREHKVDFQSVEGPKNQDGEGVQGVYGIGVEYAEEEGGVYRWLYRTTPLSLLPVDYYNGDCGQEQTTLMFPYSMMWKESCLKTCGDGTYFDLEQGDAGSLCDGKTFKVSRFWKETTFIKTIQLATELVSCVAAGCGAVYICAAGWQASCTATSSNPVTAAGSTATCTPKGVICGQTTGVAAGLAAAEGVEHLLSEPSGCDTIGDLASAGIGGGLTYLMLYNYPPAQQAASVCRSILNFGPVGSDAEGASQLVSSACIGMIGTRYASLIASWINHGFVDEEALDDRAYIDVFGSGGELSCTDWENNIGKYFVYQDCQFKSLWARLDNTETCNTAENVELYTKDLAVTDQEGISTEFNGKITVKIKSQ